MSSKKRIAILIDWYLPGNKAGGPVKSIYSLVNYFKNEYDFFIVTTNCDLDGIPYETIKPDTRTSYEEIPIYYFSREYLTLKNLGDLLSTLKLDSIYINSFYSKPFSLWPLWLNYRKKINAKFILAPRGMLSEGAMSLKSFKKKMFVIVSKLLGLHKNIVWQATTEIEKQEIQRWYPTANVHVINNLNATKPIQITEKGKQVNALKLVYLSRVTKVKNLLFALDVLKRLPTFEGTISYDIYGTIEDANYWEECKKIIDQLPSSITVNYKRELAYNEVQDTLKQYHFLFLPTLNENFGHSIVESMLSGCPVIISDCTPWRYLTSQNVGYDISLGNKQAYVDVLLSVLKMSEPDYTILVKNAVSYATLKLNIEEQATLYRTLFDN